MKIRVLAIGSLIISMSGQAMEDKPQTPGCDGSGLAAFVNECNDKGDKIIGLAGDAIIGAVHGVANFLGDVASIAVGGAAMGIEAVTVDIQMLAKDMREAGELVGDHWNDRMMLIEKHIEEHWDNLGNDVKEDWEFIQSRLADNKAGCSTSNQ